jgi:hypothetical protein
MGFFEEVDSLGIVEEHIQGVLKLEEDKAKILLRRYSEIRRELRDRLDYLPNGTFTAQQLRGVLTQVDAAITAMNISLATGMKQQASIFALRGVDDGITELQKFEQHFQGAVIPININRVLVAEDTNNFLINKYDASIRAYSEDVRAGLVGSLTNSSLMEAPLSTVVKNLGAFFMGEEWKLQRIARTELHGVYNQAKANGMIEVRDETLPDLMKTLIHPMDARTGKDSVYAAQLNLIVPIDEPFRYKWAGKERVFQNPPDRPNDRAILVPYRKSWNN